MDDFDFVEPLIVNDVWNYMKNKKIIRKEEW